MTVTIRPETAADFAAIGEIATSAFGRDNEAHLIEVLRAAPGFIPALSLVAFRDGRSVGHILFSPVRIRTVTRNVPALALAPVAVRPEVQKRSIGSGLVREGLSQCRRLRHRIVIVVGHANYYPRFGFSSARARGLEAPFPVPDASFMALELVPGALDGVRGMVEYPPAFGVV